jgi:hypothetical protein
MVGGIFLVVWIILAGLKPGLARKFIFMVLSIFEFYAERPGVF